MSCPRWVRTVLACALVGGAACGRSLPIPTDGTTPVVEPPPDTWATTGETGAPPPCATPEVEPNEAGGSATPLPLERPGCGVLTENDRDAFGFVVDDPGWLSIEVERSDGSTADLELTVDGPDGLRVDKFDDTESTDVTLKFQAVRGDYVAVVSEEEGRGGDAYTYEVLVSEAKAPVEWTLLEVEPNDTSGTAQALTGDEVSVYGTFEGNAELADRDWFELQIPGGEHALHVDVDAFTYGAAGDVKLEIRDEADALLRTMTDRVEGGQRENDPRGTYQSPGDETIRIQVLEEDGIDGPAHWYVLHLRLEAQ